MKMQFDTKSFVIASLLVLVFGGLCAAAFWSDLAMTGVDERESLSTTVRNVMLMIGALLALPLAIWRGWVAEQQVKATSESVRAAHQAISNQRFQAAAEMLGHELNAVRLGAIHVLAELANDDPEGFHINAARLLSAFILNPPQGNSVIVRTVDVKPGWEEREDVLAAIHALGTRTDDAIRVEEAQGYRVNLEECDFSGLNFRGLNLSGVLLKKANLYNTDLRNANFTDADLSHCTFGSADISGAILERAQLSGANFTQWSLDEAGEYTEEKVDPEADSVFGLRQEQLDAAQNDQNDPPKLRGVIGSSLARPLTWHGRLQDQL